MISHVIAWENAFRIIIIIEQTITNELFIIITIINIFYTEAMQNMVEITKKAHSIDGFTHPAPGGKVVPFLFIENIGEEDDDLTLIDPSFLP
jgi:hypothetical protein